SQPAATFFVMLDPMRRSRYPEPFLLLSWEPSFNARRFLTFIDEFFDLIHSEFIAVSPHARLSVRDASTLVALHDVVHEFGYWLDDGNQQMIPRAGAGDVEQVAFGVVHFLQVGIVAYRLDALLQGN